VLIFNGPLLVSSNADGGLRADSCNVTFYDKAIFTNNQLLSTFDNNLYGGAALRIGRSVVKFWQLARFENNTALPCCHGGAILMASVETDDGFATQDPYWTSDPGGLLTFAGAAVFTSNRAEKSGGAIFSVGTMLFQSSATFQRNVAITGSGGAVQARSDGCSEGSCTKAPRFYGQTSFTDNACAPRLSGCGGGMSCTSVQFYGPAVFTRNVAGNAGGGLYVWPGNAMFYEAVQAISNQAISASSGNGGATAGSGGGLAGSMAFMKSLVLRDNKASLYGGGASFMQLQMRGALSCMGNSASNGGGCMYLDGQGSIAGPTFITNNTASVAGGGISIASTGNLQFWQRRQHNFGVNMQGVVDVDITVAAGGGFSCSATPPQLMTRASAAPKPSTNYTIEGNVCGEYCRGTTCKCPTNTKFDQVLCRCVQC
jgi:predicted outer membrane repeat protein